MKGSKWGSREVRNRAANGELEVLCKLMREGLEGKLDLWLDIGHFQVFPIYRVPARQIMYFSGELRRSSAPFVMYQ